MKKIKIVLILLSLSFFVSCDSNTYQDLAPVVTNPTYTTNVKPVIDVSCTGCHAGGSQFPDLENYDQVVDATQNGDLLCRINATCGNVMPESGKLPQATIDMIQLWANNNYPN